MFQCKKAADKNPRNFSKCFIMKQKISGNFFWIIGQISQKIQKSFIVLTPGACDVILITAVIYGQMTVNVCLCYKNNLRLYSTEKMTAVTEKSIAAAK